MVIIKKTWWPKLLNLDAFRSLYGLCPKIIPVTKIQNERHIEGFLVLLSFFLRFQNFLYILLCLCCLCCLTSCLPMSFLQVECQVSKNKYTKEICKNHFPTLLFLMRGTKQNGTENSYFFLDLWVDRGSIEQNVHLLQRQYSTFTDYY